MWEQGEGGEIAKYVVYIPNHVPRAVQAEPMSQKVGILHTGTQAPGLHKEGVPSGLPLRGKHSRCITVKTNASLRSTQASNRKYRQNTAHPNGLQAGKRHASVQTARATAGILLPIHSSTVEVRRIHYDGLLRLNAHRVVLLLPPPGASLNIKARITRTHMYVRTHSK